MAHNYLTHSYLLNDEDPPVCMNINCRTYYADQLCRFWCHLPTFLYSF